MSVSERQKKILQLISEFEPINSGDLSEKLSIPLSTLKKDLSLLSAMGLVDAKKNVGYFLSKEKSNKLVMELDNITVKDVMSFPVVVNENTSIYDSCLKIIMEDCSSLYVIKDEQLVGIVSRKDLLKSLVQAQDNNETKAMPVGLIMTRQPLVVVNPNDKIMSAVKKIHDAKVDSLPVVTQEDGKNIVNGRISKTTINRVLVHILDNKIF